MTNEEKMLEAEWANIALQSATDPAKTEKALRRFLEACGGKRPSSTYGICNLAEVDAIQKDLATRSTPRTISGHRRRLWKFLQVLESLAYWAEVAAQKKP